MSPRKTTPAAATPSPDVDPSDDPRGDPSDDPRGDPSGDPSDDLSDDARTDPGDDLTEGGADAAAAGPTGATSASTPGPLAEPDAAELADIPDLGYEQARDELARIVSGLEGGQVPLEESMRMWRRGEALAAHCTAWLDGAQRQVEAATTDPT